MPIPADYVDVAERIREFYAKYPEGSLMSGCQPYMVSAGDKAYIVYHALAYREPSDSIPGHGWAWEPVPGPTPFTRDSELMNAETSAWGRAIVALGFETKKIASSEEVRNRQEFVPPVEHQHPEARPVQPSAADKQVTEGQLAQLKTTLKLLNSAFPEHPGPGRSWEIVAKEHVDGRAADRLSMAEANELNDWLEGEFLKAQQEASVPFG